MPPKDYSSISNHLSENYSSTSFPRLNLLLKKYTDGEKDEEGSRREGTARVLKRFRNFIKASSVRFPSELELMQIARLLPDPVRPGAAFIPRPWLSAGQA